MNNLILGGVFALAILAGYYGTEPTFDPEQHADFGVTIPASPPAVAVFRDVRSDAQVAEVMSEAERAADRLEAKVEAYLNR